MYHIISGVIGSRASFLLQNRDCRHFCPHDPEKEEFTRQSINVAWHGVFVQFWWSVKLEVCLRRDVFVIAGWQICHHCVCGAQTRKEWDQFSLLITRGNFKGHVKTTARPKPMLSLFPRLINGWNWVSIRCRRYQIGRGSAGFYRVCSSFCRITIIHKMEAGCVHVLCWHGWMMPRGVPVIWSHSLASM